MGKRTVYICDICGSEHSDKRSLSSVSLPTLRDDGYGNESVRRTEVEMCEDCKSRLEKLFINHFAEIHVDAFGAMKQKPELKPSPEDELRSVLARCAAQETKSAVLERSSIAALEAAHQQEIEELEDELDRLRDVKDNLFETNFRLTAQLRAMGVVVDGEGEADVEAESLTD